MGTTIDVVADTNIYRGLAAGVTRAEIASKGYRFRLTPLNALEILGLDPNVNPEKDRDFGVRRATARKMLALNAGWICDPECWHSERLGCDVQGYTFEVYDEALERLANAQDREAAQKVLNTAYARAVREAAYKQFVDKVIDIGAGYQKMCDDEGVLGGERREVATIDRLMATIDPEQLVIDQEFSRVSTSVRKLQADETAAIRECVKGEPNAELKERLRPYARLYVYYVKQHLRTGKIDRNDFGDLQFGVYPCGGLRLLTNEGQWNALAVEAGIGDQIGPYV